MKRLLFVPDTHAPYHDRRVWELMLKAAQAFKPDQIVTLGDFADCYAVSSHDKNPQRVRLLDVEIASVIDCRKDLDTLGAKEKTFIAGNHEDRLERYLTQKAPELFNLVKIRDLLKLDDNGWRFVPYKASARVGKLNLTHDVGKAGKYAHYDAQAAFEGNVIIGHTHRIGYTVVGNAQGKPHVGAMLGWLGRFEDIDYMHRVRALRDWAHGFGIGYQTADGAVHVTPIPVVASSVVIEGQHVRLRPRKEKRPRAS